MHPVYYLFFGLVVIVCVLVFAAGMLIRDPVITLNHISITSVSLPEIGLDVTLNVDNPNPMGVMLKTLVFDVYYLKGNDWVYISHGSGSGIDIKPGMNQVTLPVSIKTAELPGAGFGALMEGAITLQVKGDATPDFFLFAPRISFNQTVTIPFGGQGT